MAIPILMFGLALSVIIGAVACWKVRANVVARDAIFSRRWPRNEPDDPMPPEWRVTRATRNHVRGPDLAELNHPVFQNPLIRGPLPGIGVNDEMLDPQNHQRIGNAALTRSPAALRKLGDYSLNVTTPLLDGKWQFWQLGYGTNYDRRLRRLYDLLNLPAAQNWKSRYQEAVQETAAAYAQPAGFVLDRDEELREWYLRYQDFHPRVPRFCTTDADVVRLQIVEPHLSRIDGRPHQNVRPHSSVPWRMSQRFLDMYEAQLDLLKLIPAPTAAQLAKMQELAQKIEILKAFQQTLN